MGEIKKGILGGFSGTVGTVVGSNWRGKDIIKSRPKASGKTPTASQMEQRVKFAAAISFLAPLKGIQSLYFGEPSGSKSRVNLAASYLITQAMEMQDGLPVFVFSKVLITKGEVAGFENATATPGAATSLAFAWVDNSTQAKASPDDAFCIAVYSEVLQLFHLADGVATRQDAGATVQLPAVFAGKQVQVYAWFRNAQENAASNSIYLGSSTLT